MTLKGYIVGKLGAFGINESLLTDMSLKGLDLEAGYSTYDMDLVGRAMAEAIEELVFMPRKTNVSESGFSVSWNYEGIGRYYLYLCRKYGLTPNEDISGMLGVSMITDKSDIW